MPIIYDKGAFVAREIGAKYIECSAKTGIGVEDVFELALRESIQGNRVMATGQGRYTGGSWPCVLAKKMTTSNYYL